MKDYNTIKKDIKSNWIKKDEKKRQAIAHHYKMMINEEEAIKLSIRDSDIHGINFSFPIDKGNPEHIFINTDTVSAIKQFNTVGTGALNFITDMCALNFASYKHPGGGFLNGSMAQEEALCHESTLYEVLSNEKFNKYYEWNRKHLNNSLYLNRAIYSESIKFDDVYCDVLTCASPNWGSAMKYNNISKEENSKALRERCQYIAEILNYNAINTFITGAFGCGVFGQSPEEVANIWLSINWGKVKKIVYAVPGDNENAKVFRRIFE